jgi:hypothetical protein
MKCYRADYDVVEDGTFFDNASHEEYFWAESDDEVIDIAHDYAMSGIDFSDIGHCELYLVQIMEVDDTDECFPETRIVWS